MEMKFIYNMPALLCGKTLVISDLHMGIEHEIFEKGVRLHSFSEKMCREIEQLIEETKPKKLVLLGDVKHNIPQISIQERREIPEFINQLNQRTEVIIVKGNHDGDIEQIVSGLRIFGAEGFMEDKIAFAHGHAWPADEMFEAEKMIIGHTHPLVEFVDNLGAKSFQRCWFVGKLNPEELEKKGITLNSKLELIVMPAFSELVGGVAVNSQDKLLGPLLQQNLFKIESAHIFLLNGIDLGRAGELKII